jgi:hypothetical protein
MEFSLFILLLFIKTQFIVYWNSIMMWLSLQKKKNLLGMQTSEIIFSIKYI